jgi:hypothetical protein
MNKVWICLLMVHGCISERVEVNAYKSEAECNRALEAAQKDDGRGRCASVEYLLDETYGPQKP